MSKKLDLEVRKELKKFAQNSTECLEVLLDKKNNFTKGLIKNRNEQLLNMVDSVGIDTDEGFINSLKKINKIAKNERENVKEMEEVFKMFNVLCDNLILTNIKKS